VAAAPPQAQLLTAQNNLVRVPISEVSDGNLHIFRVEVNSTELRFLVIRKPDGTWGTALDACMICGWSGYHQNGENVTCRNCASAIYIPTIGQAGGCNPVGVASHLEGQELVLDLAALGEAARHVPQ
jgi:high-affinity iron transporter